MVGKLQGMEFAWKQWIWKCAWIFGGETELFGIDHILKNMSGKDVLNGSCKM